MLRGRGVKGSVSTSELVDAKLSSRTSQLPETSSGEAGTDRGLRAGSGEGLRGPKRRGSGDWVLRSKSTLGEAGVGERWRVMSDILDALDVGRIGGGGSSSNIVSS